MRRLLPIIWLSVITSLALEATAQAPVWEAQAQEHLDAERYVEAATLCGRWLNDVERQFGMSAAQAATPLTCVGEASLMMRNYGQAQIMFSRSIKIIEETGGAFDYRLVLPLYGLGRVYADAGNFEQAESTLLRAKDITHRNRGIFNLEQTGIVSKLSSIYYNQGEFNDARREQRFLLQANEETFGESPQLLGALRRMAKWHKITGNTLAERDLYRRAIKISEAFYGPDDLRLIGPLRDFANSYIETPRVNRVFSGEGKKALTRVIDILQAQEFVDQADLARAWTDLGDWFTLSGSRGRGASAYNTAWNILPKTDSDDDQKLLDSYSDPVEIEYEPWPVQIRSSKLRNLPPGELEVEFEFTVSETGRVKRIQIVKDEVGIREVVNQIGMNVKHSRYRPRMIDGVPVATPGVRKVIRTSFNSLQEQAQSTEADEQTENAPDEIESAQENSQEGTEQVPPDDESSLE